MHARRSLLLLHGALGAASQFEPLLPLLAERFEARTLDFPGHGGGAAATEPFSIASFAASLATEIERAGNAPADIFGYSMGGYVALYLARRRPELIGRIFTLATKFAWNPETAAREAAMLNPDGMEAKVPKFAAQLRERHAPADWRSVVERTAEMMTVLGAEPALTMADLAEVEQEVTIGVGDRDQMVSLEESAAAYRSLPNGRFVVLPGTPHPLERAAPARLVRELEEHFLMSNDASKR